METLSRCEASMETLSRCEASMETLSRCAAMAKLSGETNISIKTIGRYVLCDVDPATPLLVKCEDYEEFENAIIPLGKYQSSDWVDDLDVARDTRDLPSGRYAPLLNGNEVVILRKDISIVIRHPIGVLITRHTSSSGFTRKQLVELIIDGYRRS